MKKPIHSSRLTGVPIPPLSVVRLAAYPRTSPGWKKRLGSIYRVGYYSGRDGLDCIWLVDESGDYCETVDHNYLFKYFDLIQVSREKNLYGRGMPKIAPVVLARKDLGSHLNAKRR